MLLHPGGRLTLENPQGDSYILARSPDGQSVGVGPLQDGADPALLPIPVLKWMLQCCGYIVIEREDVAHLSEKETQT